MESASNVVGYSDLAFGFVEGINSIGPIIPAVAPDLKLTLKVVLEDADKQVFIDLGGRPPKAEIITENRPADIILHAKQRDFHDFLRGKLNIIKAWNDKKMLLEFTPTALGGIPSRKPTGSERPVGLPGFLYEMYLVSIGADKILEEGNEGTVELQPRKKGIFSKVIGAFAWMGGVLFGVALRLFKRFHREPAPDEPPEIEVTEVTEPPAPAPPPEPGKIARAVMGWFFRRVDMFGVARSFVAGARAVGAA